MAPILVANPRSDAVFAQVAKELSRQGVHGPADLQARLRGRYPDAIVRARDLSGDTRAIWYVYRDGRWVPPDWATPRE
jgi:hypothetical protein